jgi:hypothetical protein
MSYETIVNFLSAQSPGYVWRFPVGGAAGQNLRYQSYWRVPFGKAAQTILFPVLYDVRAGRFYFPAPVAWDNPFQTKTK